MCTVFLKRYNLLSIISHRIALLVIDKACHKTNKKKSVIDIKGNTLSLSDFRVNMIEISTIPRRVFIPN